MSSNEVAVIDAHAHKEVQRIKIGGENPQPIGLVVDPRGRYAYVACSGAKRIDVLDLGSLAITGGFETGNGPDGMGWIRWNPAFREVFPDDERKSAMRE